ncbi:glycogen synthase GlgA [Schlegelella sp. S2-27]|uniref:Glycogen synthase n=1 Tax=Caldimonas mangrovi TaxID=2944811 RepID=A0ABT0YR76_9BURK|nr:glycogen synthase GlgA [Caldimonas mangrovi]MCM5681240.1 glycogen synthase GlgA [Caldimonas mangrovi]
MIDADALPPLKILFATPECAPWVKTGGLGDVSAALPRALAALGHDVKLLMPLYAPLKKLTARATRSVHIEAKGPWPASRLVCWRPKGLPFELLLLDCAELFQQGGGPYDDSGGDHARRFGWLSRVAALLASDATPWPQWRPDVLHGNDWPAGLAPAYLRTLPAPHARTVFTIHNLAFQGLFPLDRAPQLELPPAWLTPDGIEYWGRLSFLKAGIHEADAITTVSPTYAREILHEAHGCGFDGILRSRAERLHGILNGIDTSVWNPATDELLPMRYSAEQLDGKSLNKQALQERLRLHTDPHAPLFGMVSRLTHQKGVDLVLDVLPWLVEQGAQVAVLGQGDADLERALQDAAARHPGRVSVQLGFDETLAHLIEGGADAYLMPSRFEPCGLNQMYSQAYGTLPVARATGGLADTIVDLSAGPEAATGFLFEASTADALQVTLRRVLDAWSAPEVWHAMQRRGMQQQLDWSGSARRYEALYRSLR